MDAFVSHHDENECRLSAGWFNIIKPSTRRGPEETYLLIIPMVRIEEGAGEAWDGATTIIRKILENIHLNEIVVIPSKKRSFAIISLKTSTKMFP
jgi:hypothetical protein